MAVLRLSLLGPFAATVDEQPISSFRTKATQALLVYLACQPDQAHRREHLMTTLWPGLPQKSAQANLRQTLYQLRQAIPETAARQGEDPVPLLLSDWQTIQINPEAALEVDVLAFEDLLGQGEASWAEAVELYQGDFLADFYLPDSESFEEWVLARRQALRGRALKTLETLAERALKDGDLEAAEDYARRELSIDSLREGAHRRLMTTLARSSRRTEALTQYEELVRLLAEELGVEPAAETQALQERIRGGELSRVPAAADLTEKPVRLPAFLAADAVQEKERPVFVGRERELGWLRERLTLAAQGRGQVAFVLGEAGGGKTALMEAFALSTADEQPEMLVVWGSCNAFTGRGDPFLPFRDCLSMLTGDVEPAWAAGAITRRQAHDLWAAIPQILPALLAHGPDLIDTIVPGSALVRRVEEALGLASALPEQLKERVENERSATGARDRPQLLEQVGGLLRAVAATQPLLLLLDDLQWADAGSVELLFHLGRRLSDSRIMILGAYRPEDLTASQDGANHPLPPVLRELARLYGDMSLDLAEAEARGFIDNLLDSEPNHLDESFREKLLARTGGQALFAVELLRELQETGGLVRDESDAWTASPDLDWAALPARVEGVIATRIGRLSEVERELLTIAAVEGETFTAQVVARVQEVSERQTLRALSRELEKRHGLVQERAAVKVDGRLLARYRFVHALFQQYLYDELSAAERRMLHGDIAAILEEFYAGRTEEMAVSLARHYVEAGEGEKALPHLLAAGDEARRLYVFEEATESYDQALNILKERGDFEGAARVLMKLGLTYHSAFDFDRAGQAYEEGFSLRRRSRALLPLTSLPPAPHAFRTSWSAVPPTLDPTRSNEGELIADLFSGLVRMTSDLDIVPDAAESWEVLEGGRTYLFHLRADASWSDGRPVTAGDFILAWQRALDPEGGSPMANVLYDVKGAADRHQGGRSGAGQLGLSAPDPHTLYVELERPTSYFLQALTSAPAAPVPGQAVDLLGETWAEPDRIVSNGPFLLASWSPDDTLVLERNPAYGPGFDGNLERMELLVGRDSQTVLSLYASDRLDMIDAWPFSPSELTIALRRHADDYQNWPTGLTGFVGFNVNRSPFDDPRVRRAFVLATDRQGGAKAHEMGRAFPSTGGFVPPGVPGHVSGIALPFDVPQAQELLDQAGYEDRHRLPVITALLAPWDASRIPDLLKLWETRLGIKTSWEIVAWEDYHRRVASEQPHIFAYGWDSPHLDPDGYLRFGLQFISSWHDDAYTHLVEKARNIMDHAERMKLYRRAEEILAVQAPIMPILYVRKPAFVKPWVRNHRPPLANIHFWHDVIIEPH